MIIAIDRNRLKSAQITVEDKNYEKGVLIFRNKKWYLRKNNKEIEVEEVYKISGTPQGLYIKLFNDPVLKQQYKNSLIKLPGNWRNKRD